VVVNFEALAQAGYRTIYLTYTSGIFQIVAQDTKQAVNITTYQTLAQLITITDIGGIDTFDAPTLNGMAGSNNLYVTAINNANNTNFINTDLT
jgi:hypothetical protein